MRFCSSFPYNAKLCLNGNEWANRRAAKAGIGFSALDNAFAAFEEPADVGQVQAMCATLGPAQMEALLRKWLAWVITAGVTPSLHADHKNTTIKQYHKEGRALRTETTINKTRGFYIGND